MRAGGLESLSESGPKSSVTPLTSVDNSTGPIRQDWRTGPELGYKQRRDVPIQYESERRPVFGL
jgi:hypothetical protein